MYFMYFIEHPAPHIFPRRSSSGSLGNPTLRIRPLTEKPDKNSITEQNPLIISHLACLPSRRYRQPCPRILVLVGRNNQTVGRLAQRGNIETELDEEDAIMVGLLSHQNVRGAVLLFVCFLMLATICALAALSTLMRPAKWIERVH